MAHSHSHSNSNPILIILALGTALSSIALAAPLHPDPGSTLSVMMRRELEDHFAGIDNDFLSSSCSFATHAPLARLAGCSTIDRSQMPPESLSSREDDVNEPDDVHRLIFPSSSSSRPVPLPTPGLTARGVILQKQPDASQQAGDGGSSAAPAADANPESPPSQDAIVSETVLGRDKPLWTVDTVYIELKRLKSWYPDMYKADGNMDRFRVSTSGQIYTKLVEEIRKLDAKFNFRWLSRSLRGQLLSVYRISQAHALRTGGGPRPAQGSQVGSGKS
ncbi:hypothetical protein EV361DRAFT_586869 [Lentinula raphanica]|nr:hypothetical protein EV361DRAFT_586869 [Lentinula raphanica]